MEISYINDPLPQIDKRQFLLVLLVTLAATFALHEFPVYFAGIMVAIIFLAGVYNLPELGIAVLVNGLGLIGYFGQNVETSGFVIPVIVMLYTPALIHYALNHKLRWKFGLVPGLVLFIGALLFIGVLYSPVPSQGFVKAGKYLAINAFIFFATMFFINDINRLKSTLRLLALFGFAITAISIVYMAYAGVGSITRFTLPAHNPIWFARGLGISLLATFFLLQVTKKKVEKLVYLSFILVMLFLTYIAASRGPFLALLISLLFYFLLAHARRFDFLKGLISFLVILFALRLYIVIAPERILTRMLSLFSRFDLSTFSRLQAFETAKNLFLDNPIKGAGTAGFGHFSILSYPHNMFLELASEIGILGVLACIILVFYTAYLGIKLLRNKKASFLELNLIKAYFAIFIFALINSQVSGAIYNNVQLWFASAGIWTLYCRELKYSTRR